jgi:hypothetical protein
LEIKRELMCGPIDGVWKLANWQRVRMKAVRLLGTDHVYTQGCSKAKWPATMKLEAFDFDTNSGGKCKF